MDYRQFVDATEQLGAYYRYWLEYSGWQPSAERFIEHGLDRGFRHHCRVGPMTFQEYYDVLSFVRESSNRLLGRFGVVFDRTGATFIFEDQTDYALFLLRCPDVIVDIG